MLPFDELTPKKRQLSKHDYLFHCGDEANAIYFVVRGEIHGLRYQPDGKQALMMRARDNEFFASSALQISHLPCNAIAAVNSEILVFDKATFIQAMQNNTYLSLFFARSISFSLKKQCSAAERLRLKSTRDRIVHYVVCESVDNQITLPFSLQTWANELAVEPESLHRTLKQMQESGELLKEGKRLTLLINS